MTFIGKPVEVVAFLILVLATFLYYELVLRGAKP